MTVASAAQPERGLPHSVTCVICRSHVERFLPYGNPPRPHAQCPDCKSLERHRLVRLLFDRRPELLAPPLRVLHVAPERAFFRMFRESPGIDYTPCDLYAEGYSYPQGVENVDITQAPYADGWFDLILCSHVLEHIPDDRRAMRELLRILKPGGNAVFLVPVRFELDATYEDSTITSREERAKAFGQQAHVRCYGRDFPARLRESGFHVEVVRLAEQESPELRAIYGLLTREEVYLCRHP